MKIAYCSDLHLEIATVKIQNPGADVLVLAGDICNTREIPYGWFKHVTSEFKSVIWVMGNHESYGSSLEASLAAAREVPGVTVLQDEGVVIDGKLFWGTTLWSDLSDPISAWAAGRQMNDYRMITYRGRTLRPEDTTQLFKQSILLLSQARPDVVITHHAPSMQSVAPQYKGDSLNPAYASPLDRLIEDISPGLWIHGHIHTGTTYSIHNTKICANPRGYLGYEPAASSWRIACCEV